MVIYIMPWAIGSAGLERHVDIVEIVGSNPTSPTIKKHLHIVDAFNLYRIYQKILYSPYLYPYRYQHKLFYSFPL